MDFYKMPYNYQYKYLVTIYENTCVSVYKYDKFKFDPPFLSFHAKYIFIGKTNVCPMTEVSRSEDKEGFDGNTLLLEFENIEYLYISGLEIIKFKTEDKIIDYKSLMGNNMIPYAFIIGKNYSYFLYHRYKFIEKDKIEEGTLLNAANDSLDPFDYHLKKCGIDSFKKIRT